MPYTHQWNLTLERQLPWQSTPAPDLQRHRAAAACCATCPTTCAVSPADGGIVVVNHPNNAPAAGSPDLRGVRIDRVAADWRCAGTGVIPEHARERDLPGGGADREQRDQPARPAHQRAAARSALHDQPDRQQRRQHLVQRAADRVGQDAAARAVVLRHLHLEQGHRRHVGGDVRRRRRQQPAGAATRASRAGRRASTRRTASRSTASISCPSSARPARLGWPRRGRLAGLGGGEARARHAVHRHRHGGRRSQLGRLPGEPADDPRPVDPRLDDWQYRHRRAGPAPIRRSSARRRRASRTWSDATRSTRTAFATWTWG